MLPRQASGGATQGYAARARVTSNSSSTSGSVVGSTTRRMLGSTMAAAATTTMTDNMMATLSVKDVQRCFEKERRAFIRDLECLRQQLVKKDQLSQKAATVASQHAIQLKKEIASLQAALSASEKDGAKYQDQFRHTSSLLETALDQHQADQAKLSELSETVRTMERKHDDAVALIRKEAAANVNNTQEERKALRARVDQLRCKLESERKEWQTIKKPLGDDLDKTKMKLQLVEKELGESRYREQSSFQLKEKMNSEVIMYKRKVTDLTSALQDTLQSKSQMKAEFQLMDRKMKEKARELIKSHQLSKEQLLMIQEDYNGLFRSREQLVEQNEKVFHSARAMKTRHEILVKEKENELWELEKKMKKNSATCTVCMKTQEQRVEEFDRKMDSVKEQTRLHVAKEMELERWDRYQEMNAKYMDLTAQWQEVVKENDYSHKEMKELKKKYEELEAKEQKMVDLLSRAEKKCNELNIKTQEEARKNEENKQQIHDLMENLSKMTTVTADQSKQLQEVELGRREEIDRMKSLLKALETEKQALLAEKDNLQHQLDQQGNEYDQLHNDKTTQWNEIMAAQLSANLLIEEQAHTIDNLLKSKYVSPSKDKLTSSSSSSSSSIPQYHGERQISSSSSSPSSAQEGGGGGADPQRESAAVLVLRRECERLREELTTHKEHLYAQQEQLQCEYEKKVVALMKEVTTTQRERNKLKKKLADQAVTIHELTLQEDDDEEDEEDEDEGEQLYEDGAESDEMDIISEPDEDDEADARELQRVLPVPSQLRSLHHQYQQNHRQQDHDLQSQHNRKRSTTTGREDTNGHHRSMVPTERRASSRTASSSATKANPRIRSRGSVNFKNMSQDLSAIHPGYDDTRSDEDDDDPTVAISFLSGT